MKYIIRVSHWEYSLTFLGIKPTIFIILATYYYLNHHNSFETIVIATVSISTSQYFCIQCMSMYSSLKITSFKVLLFYINVVFIVMTMTPAINSHYIMLPCKETQAITDGYLLTMVIHLYCYYNNLCIPEVPQWVIQNTWPKVIEKQLHERQYHVQLCTWRLENITESLCEMLSKT